MGEEEEEEGEGRIGVQILMVVSAEQVASCLRVRASVCQPTLPPPPLENFARRRSRTDFVSGEMRTRIRYREWAWKRVFGCKSVKANPGWIVQT